MKKSLSYFFNTNEGSHTWVKIVIKEILRNIEKNKAVEILEHANKLKKRVIRDYTYYPFYTYTTKDNKEILQNTKICSAFANDYHSILIIAQKTPQLRMEIDTLREIAGGLNIACAVLAKEELDLTQYFPNKILSSIRLLYWGMTETFNYRLSENIDALRKGIITLENEQVRTKESIKRRKETANENHKIMIQLATAVVSEHSNSDKQKITKQKVAEKVCEKLKEMKIAPYEGSSDISRTYSIGTIYKIISPHI